MGSIKYLWSNGHKGIVISLTYLAAALVFLLAALIFSYFWAHQDGFDPLYFGRGIVVQSPVSVSSAGLDANFEICNREDETLTAHVSTKWMQQLGDGAVHVVLGREFSAERPSGCTDVIFTDAPIPVGVSSAKSGGWTYMVTYEVDRGTKTQVISTTSPAFEVVP
jgi:hypothetical protein